MLRAEGPEQEVKRNVGAMGAKPEPVPQAPARGQHLLKRIPSHSEADARSDPDQMQGICVLGIRSPGVENASKGLEPKPSG